MEKTVRKPERTCLGCRNTYHQEMLLRYVLTPDGQIYPDYRNKLPGRGAYTCFDPECIKKAIRQNRFERAFKKSISAPDATVLLQQVKDQLFLRVLSLVGIARKSGNIVTGSSAVSIMLGSSDLPVVILLAEDVSEGIASKIIFKAEKNRVPVYRFLDKETMGQIVGKDERSVVALKKSGVANAIMAELLKYKNM